MSRDKTMKALAKSEFEAWAGTYDRSLLNRFLFQPSYRMFLEELQAWRGDMAAPFDLLDVGCGTGTFDAMLAASPLPARIVGLDYAEAMCHVAVSKARAAEASDRLRYVNADSQHLPFADASFDVVTCSNSFHHYPDQQQVVHEMRRILRPGGRLLLIDGFRDNIVGWVAFDVIIGHVEKEVFHAPGPKSTSISPPPASATSAAANSASGCPACSRSVWPDPFPCDSVRLRTRHVRLTSISISETFDTTVAAVVRRSTRDA